MAAAATLGTGAAIAAAAGDDDVRACVVKRTGELHAAGGGKCARGEFAITIGGKAFKKGRRGGTLTINGVAFKRGRGQTLTINGTSFRTGTLPRTLTINGTSFQTGTLPKSLTINGNSFRSDGQTLTINGTTFEPGSAGKPGPPGPAGPPGPSGTVAGPPPRENPGPVAMKLGAGRLTLAGGANFTAGETRRVLVTGGFTAVCVGCSGAVEGTWELQRDGETVVQRRIGTLSGEETAGVALSEIVVTKGACSPCEFRLVASAAADAAGGGGQIDAHDIRLGVVDAGAVSG